MNNENFELQEIFDTGMSASYVLDSGYAWIAVFISFWLHFILDGLTFSFGQLFEAIREKFDINRTSASFIAAYFFALPLFCSPLAKVIGDNIGCKRQLIGGLSLNIVGISIALAGLLSESVVVFSIGFSVFLPLGMTFVYNGAILIINLSFEKRVGIANSLAVSGTGVGTMALPFIMDQLEKSFPGETAFATCAFTQVVCVADLLMLNLLVKFVEKIWASVKLARTEGSGENGCSELVEEGVSVRRCVSLPSVFSEDSEVDSDSAKSYDGDRYVISVCCLYLVLDVPYAFFFDHAHHNLSMSKSDASRFASILGGAQLISTWVIGFVADLSFLKNKLFFLNGISMFLMGAGLFLASVATGFSEMMVSSVIVGSSVSSNYVLQSILLRKLYPDTKMFTAAYSMTCMFSGVANFIGPPIFGYIREKTGNYFVIFVVSGIFLVLSGVFSFCAGYQLRYKARNSLTPSTDSRENPLIDLA